MLIFKELATVYLASRGQHFVGVITAEELVKALNAVMQTQGDEWDDGYNPSLNSAIEKAFGALDRRNHDGDYVMFSVAGAMFYQFVKDQLKEEASRV